MTKSAAGKARTTYAGLDVSLKETAICIVDDGGKIILERAVPTDPQVIGKFLRKYGPGLERFGLESGATSAWLWREFRGMGLPVICLDSRHAHRVLSMKRNKNDRNDARGLADLVRMGWYREARVRSIDAQFVRSMLLSRQQLLQSRRAIENQIRGALKTLGVMTGPTKGRGFMPRVTELRADNDWLGPVLDPLIAAHASIAKQLKTVSASADCMSSSTNEATHPRCSIEGCPDRPGRASYMEGESWGIIAKLSSESIRRNRVMQWQLPKAAVAVRCAISGSSPPPRRQHASSLPSLRLNTVI